MKIVRVFTLFSSPRCSLCDPVREVLEDAVTSSKGSLKLEVVDISEKANAKWFFLYRNDIPVVHLDGVEIARHRLSQDDVERFID